MNRIYTGQLLLTLIIAQSTCFGHPTLPEPNNDSLLASFKTGTWYEVEALRGKDCMTFYCQSGVPSLQAHQEDQTVHWFYGQEADRFQMEVVRQEGSSFFTTLTNQDALSISVTFKWLSPYRLQVHMDQGIQTFVHESKLSKVVFKWYQNHECDMERRYPKDTLDGQAIDYYLNHPELSDLLRESFVGLQPRSGSELSQEVVEKPLAEMHGFYTVLLTQAVLRTSNEENELKVVASHLKRWVENDPNLFLAHLVEQQMPFEYIEAWANALKEVLPEEQREQWLQHLKQQLDLASKTKWEPYWNQF
ncbi:MAG: hypothetical protein AAFQ98_01880, partial [Bacteroidota bacterium]